MFLFSRVFNGDGIISGRLNCFALGDFRPFFFREEPLCGVPAESKRQHATQARRHRIISQNTQRLKVCPTVKTHAKKIHVISILDHCATSTEATRRKVPLQMWGGRVSASHPNPTPNRIVLFVLHCRGFAAVTELWKFIYPGSAISAGKKTLLFH